MINLDNPRQWVVWGFTKEHNYCTHSHVMEGFYRALKLTGKNVLWLDHSSDLTGVDFSDTFFISEHRAALSGMPIRDDGFYCIHGLNNDPEMFAKISHIKNRLSHNVYHDYSHGNPEQWLRQGCPQIKTVVEYEAFLANQEPDGARNWERIFLAEDTPYYPREKHMDFRWATDLLPHEIEANKPGIVLANNKVIWWIGTQWFVNQKELSEFKQASSDSGIDFRAVGAGQNGVLSMEDNINLVRESYLAPAISGSHHITEGYAPCRIFKNISYGRMGITNSARVNAIFGGKLIYNPNCYDLFYDAQEQLKSLEVSRIHELMDEVAAKHTYLNRIDSILKAAKLVLEDK